MGVDAELAGRIMADIELEQKHEASLPEQVEILFEEQLRLEMKDPRRCGLRVELQDEENGKSVGVIEWSALTFLAGSPSLEDDHQAYVLDTRGSAQYGEPKIYLKRALRVVQPVGSASRW